MGRDTTASKRMAAKRSREKAAGFRRLNIAVRPEVLEKLAELMNRHNCASQAKVIELLVMTESADLVAGPSKEVRNEVTEEVTKVTEEALKTPLEKQQEITQKTQKKRSPVKAVDSKIGIVIAHNKISSPQMSLFES